MERFPPKHWNKINIPPLPPNCNHHWARGSRFLEWQGQGSVDYVVAWQTTQPPSEKWCSVPPVSPYVAQLSEDAELIKTFNDFNLKTINIYTKTLMQVKYHMKSRIPYRDSLSFYHNNTWSMALEIYISLLKYHIRRTRRLRWAPGIERPSMNTK